MLKSITWNKGNNPDLDDLFDQLRQKRYEDKSHRLWANYDKKFLDHVEALTICFEDDIPIICSSISYRSCWPNDVYRILNRTWKSGKQRKYSKTVGPRILNIVASQTQWLNNNRKPSLTFISRQTVKWTTFVAVGLREFGMDYKTDEYFYLTCPNECDQTCWQKIVYTGDESKLQEWKRKTLDQNI